MKLLFQTFLCYNADYVGGDGEDEGTVYIRKLRPYHLTLPVKVEKLLKASLDLYPSPSPSVKIQIMGGTICSRCKGKTLLGIVNKLLKTKRFVDITQQCFALLAQVTFPPII